MNKKTWIIFGVICVVILGGLIVVSQKNKTNVTDINPNEIQPAMAADGFIADHTLGVKDSKVTLIEYGDFQCPYCGDAYPQMKKITDEYASKITFVFRNFPLTTSHPNAKAAASAAEAAGLQDKYWQMFDKLYENQSEWSNLSTDKRTGVFVAYATAIGVKDINKFKTDMDSSDVSKKINFDLGLGKKAGVTGTPAFFLNGTKVSEDVSSSVINGNGDKLREAIDNALK